MSKIPHIIGNIKNGEVLLNVFFNFTTLFGELTPEYFCENCSNSVIVFSFQWEFDIKVIRLTPQYKKTITY